MLYAVKNISKSFSTPSGEALILKDISFSMEKGERVAIVGASGSGKTSFLQLLGTLDSPSTGEIYFLDKDIAKFSPVEKAQMRNKDMGFVFQFHQLLQEFSVLENVAMPLFIANKNKKEAHDLAAEALTLVGLGHKTAVAIGTLSGGERQRVALARAIVQRPQVVLADEPTGSLDVRSGEEIGELFIRLNEEIGMSFVVVTHNLQLAEKMHRKMELSLGGLNEI